MSSGARESVDISGYSLEQLQMMREGMTNDIKTLTQNYKSLKQAQGRFRSSKAAVDAFAATKVGSTMLVPLTNAQFVPGSEANNEDVIVDLGTGYYAGSTVTGAKELLDRKIGYLDRNTDALQQQIQAKQENLRAVMSTMSGKMQAQRAAGK